MLLLHPHRGRLPLVHPASETSPQWQALSTELQSQLISALGKMMNSYLAAEEGTDDGAREVENLERREAGED